MKLGIDVGNFNVKTSRGVIFKSSVSTVDTFSIGDRDVLVYNDKKYFLGEGEFEIDYIKFKKDNYIPLLLGAIGKSCGSNNSSISLGLGLPLNQYRDLKSEFKEFLEDREFKFFLNDVEYNIKITTVTICPEGVSGYVANNQKYDIKNRDIIICDIGGKTTDIALIQNKKVIKNSTVNYGTLDIYNNIKIELEKSFIGAKIQIEKVDDYIKKGFFYKNKKQDISFAIKSSNNIYKEILNELTLNYPINTEAFIIGGGGSYIIGNIFKSKIPHLIIEDDIFFNAEGFEKLAK